MAEPSRSRTWLQMWSATISTVVFPARERRQRVEVGGIELGETLGDSAAPSASRSSSIAFSVELLAAHHDLDAVVVAVLVAGGRIAPPRAGAGRGTSERRRPQT